jgi:hypothetical protein
MYGSICLMPEDERTGPAHPPPALQTGPPEAFARGHPCGFGLSDPERHVQAAPVRATPCCEPQHRLLQTAGTAAIAGGEGQPPAGGAGMLQGGFRGLCSRCASAKALKYRLNFLYSGENVAGKPPHRHRYMRMLTCRSKLCHRRLFPYCLYDILVIHSTSVQF